MASVSSKELSPDLMSWEDEAAAVIRDVKDTVKEITVADKLKSDGKRIYLNVTTFEDSEFTIELSGFGFRVVGNKHNSWSEPSETYYDTPYAMLSTISPSYSAKFAESLCKALSLDSK